MTQTIGYYCDECRMKYVRHVCRDGLPCDHDKAQAVQVYAKAYGRGGEEVEMKWAGGHVSFWILEKPKREGVAYMGWQARFLHGFQIETEDGTTSVLEWLQRQESKIIRAFMDRWDSHKQPPLWRRLEQWRTERENLPRRGICSDCGNSSVRLLDTPLVRFKIDAPGGLLVEGNTVWWNPTGDRPPDPYDIVKVEEDVRDEDKVGIVATAPGAAPDELVCWRCFAGYLWPALRPYVINIPPELVWNEDNPWRDPVWISQGREETRKDDHGEE